MPRIRPKVLVDEKYESQTSYTINLDLPDTGRLSTLFLKVKAKTATTGNAPNPWMKYLISSVSVNEGGQAALNAAPPEVFAADFYYKTGRMPQMGFQRPGGDGALVDEVIPIMFGEKINDPDHYIDLAKLSDPKLSVTYNLAETDHTAQTLWNTAYYPRFTVFANLFQGVGIPASKGFYSLRQSELWTPANSEKHLFEVKGPRPVKRLYMQQDTLMPNEEFLHLVNRVRLWGDNEGIIPFDMEAWPYTELIRELYGICEVDAYVPYAKGGQGIDIVTDRFLGGTVKLPVTPTVQAHIQNAAGRYGTFKCITSSSGGASTAVLQAELNIKGLAPWSVYPIDMEKMLGMEHLRPEEFAPMFLELEHASNAGDYSASMRIHTQDLVV